MPRRRSGCVPLNLEDRLKEAERACAIRDGIFTPLRRKILTFLLESERPVKAYALLKRLKNDQGAQPPTVYRTLDFLREMGLVHRIESLQAFVPCRHWKHGHAAAFLICDSCGAVAEFDAVESLRKLNQAAAGVKFKARDAVVEVRGACPECA